MAIRLNDSMVSRIAAELEATAARALPDVLTLVQRARDRRRSAPCPVCVRGEASPAAIHEHNLRCAEYGERRYPSPAARMPALGDD
jgi:hypothetical protein